MIKLKKIRIEKGLTQKQLADKADVHLRMIQNYEGGQRNINGAAVLTIYRLAKVLECDMEDLIEFE